MPYYYIIKSKYLDPKFIKDTMGKRKIWEEFNIKKPQKINPDFIHIDQYYSSDKSLYKYQSKLKSQINQNDTEIYKGKFNLIESLKKLNDTKLNKMLLEQHHINLYLIYKKKESLLKYKPLFLKKKVWIFKFIYGDSGDNIIIIKSYKQLEDFINSIIDKKFKEWNKIKLLDYKYFRQIKKKNYLIEWLIQEYINEPLLYEKKKFHLRGYFLYLNKTNKSKEGYILNNHRIFTSKLKYKNEDYLNKYIHDTHEKSTSKYINFKPNLEEKIPIDKFKKIENDIIYLFKSILKITNNSCFIEDKNCYHLFGSDIMITNKYEIKLIEINRSVGLPSYNAPQKKINHPYHIFLGIMENIVDKYFQHNMNLKKYNNFIKL